MSKNLHNSILKQKECTQGTRFLVVSDLKLAKDKRVLIWDRGGFFTKEQRKKNYTICEEHFKQLSSEFFKRKACLHPEHQQKEGPLDKFKFKGSSSKLIRQISRQDSFLYYQNYGKLIPTRAFLCNTHYKYLKMELKLADAQQQLRELEKDSDSDGDKDEEPKSPDPLAPPPTPPPPPEPESPRSDGDVQMQEMSSPRADSDMASEKTDPSPTKSDPKSDPNDPTFKLQDEDLKAAMNARIEVLNKLLEENNDKHRFKSIMTKTFSEYKHRRKRHWLNLLGTTIAAVIHSVNHDSSDDMNIWTEVMQSRFVEKSMKGKLKPSGLVEKVILSYNATTSRRERLRILSLVSGHYSFSYLSQFNKKKENVTRVTKRKEIESDEEDSDGYGPSKFYKDITLTEDQEVHFEEKEEEDKGEDFDEDLNVALEDPVEVKAFWSPQLDEHTYYESKKHFIHNGFAFAPLEATVSRRKRLEPAMIEVLESFLTSSDIIQDTAYGSRRMTDATGETHTVARICRVMSATELVNLSRAYLIEVTMTF